MVGVPYVSFVANKIKNAKGETANYSCCAVRHWLGQVWQEFDRVKLVDLVSGEGAVNGGGDPLAALGGDDLQR